MVSPDQTTVYFGEAGGAFGSVSKPNLTFTGSVITRPYLSDAKHWYQPNRDQTSGKKPYVIMQLIRLFKNINILLAGYLQPVIWNSRHITQFLDGAQDISVFCRRHWTEYTNVLCQKDKTKTDGIFFRASSYPPNIKLPLLTVPKWLQNMLK